MDFKEQYKKANDEITGDSALLEKILSTPKKEKTKIIPIVYKAASLAAAFILIVTIALVPGIKEKFIAEETPVKETITEVATEEETEEAATEVFTANENLKTDEVYSGKTEEVVVNRKNETVVKSEVKEEPTPTEISEVTEEVAPALFTADELPVEAVTEEKAASGGGSSAVMKSVGPRAKAYTARDILTHTGINIESLTLDEMAINEDYVIAEFSPDGVLEFYDLGITLSEGKKSMTVRIVRSSMPVAYDVTEDNDMISASKSLGNSDIFITAYNMAIEEVENYLNKIA